MRDAGLAFRLYFQVSSAPQSSDTLPVAGSFVASLFRLAVLYVRGDIRRGVEGGGSDRLCRFSAFRRGVKAGMRWEWHLRGRGRDVVMLETCYCGGFKAVTRRRRLQVTGVHGEIVASNWGDVGAVVAPNARE